MSIQFARSQEPAYDELTIFFQAKNIGNIEIPALIRDQQVLLPVNDLFNFLRIRSSISAGMDSVYGFFLTPDATFGIDRNANRIVYKGKNYLLKPGDLIKTETNLYLESKYFNDIFGLTCKFNIRTLSVDMTTQLELPMMREMRLEQMRQNVSRLKGETKVDTVIQQSHKAFHFGMADWSVISTQSPGLNSDNRFNLGLGAVIAGGEANAFLNYNPNEVFSEKQQYYYWRYVNNNNSFLRQTVLGKINTDAVSSIYNPVVGFRLTNTPTTYRRSFGTYPISDYTNPNWTVELYVNNVLVEYKKADASGFFTFQVPLVYGNSAIKLKFYGPYGEERSKEQNITIPFNFLPAKEFEYNLTGGMVEDDQNSIYSKASLNYGVSNNITLGTGVEYLSSVTTGTVMPFVNFASRPIKNVLLSGEYVYGVRGRGMFTYTLPKNIQFELDYTKYKPGQMAVNFNYLEERKAILTLPFYGKNFSFYNRMTYNNILLPGTGYSTAEWLISGAVGNVSANLTNYAMILRDTDPYIYSNLALSFRLPFGILIVPQAQYEYSQHEMISAKIGMEKYFFKNGFFTLSYENNFKNKIQNTQIGLRYDLPFTQTALTVRQTNDQTTYMEMARGSLVFDAKNHYVGANNRSSVGKAGIVFAPYLDINCNNQRDPGEPRAYGLNIRISGGNTVKSDRDTTIRVSDLEPYAKYYVEMDGDGFDNVAWKLRMKAMSIVADPNIFKLVEIPVQVVGEVSGTVTMQKSSGSEGLGRIILNIFDKRGNLAGRTLSEEDGYFSYLGLAPGDYEISVDSAQIRKLSLIASHARYQFTVKVDRDGDILEGMDFALTSTKKEEIISQAGMDTTQTSKIADQTKDLTRNESLYYIQVGAFVYKQNASQLALKLAGIAKCQVVVIMESIFYKVRLGGFNTKAELNACKDVIISSGLFTVDQIYLILPSKIVKPVKTLPAAKPISTKPATVNPASAKPVITKPAITKPVSVKMPVVRKKLYFVQLGAFTDQRNAARIIVNSTHTIPYKLEIIHHGQLYKVRFGGFNTRKEAEECIRKIDEKGMVTKEKLIIVSEVAAPDDTKIPDAAFSVPGHTGPTVQVGSFLHKENAQKFSEKMSSEAPFPIFIIEEHGIFAVRFGPFKNLPEIQSCIKLMENKGFKCIVVK